MSNHFKAYVRILNGNRMYIYEMYQVKHRHPDSLMEEALSGACFDGVMIISILI